MTVLAYHRIDAGRDFAWNLVSPARLARQMETLARRGHRVLPLGEALGEKEGREGKVVAVTIDDAFEGAVRDGPAILGRFGFRGTIFAPTAWAGRCNRWDTTLVGRRCRHASWDDLGRAAAAGWEIGSHGHTHRDLTRLGTDELASELETSRDEIRRRLAVDPLSLAYPFGRADRRVVRAARKAGFTIGCLSRLGRGGEDRMRTGRIGVRRFEGDAEFVSKVEGGILFRWQTAKDRIASFASGGTPRFVHRFRKVEAPC